MKILYKVSWCVIVFAMCYSMANAQDLGNISGQKPFNISGSLEARGIAYSVSGIAERRSPFTYLFSGSPVISLYGFTIPFTISLSESDRSFRQPFNQFGMSPTYKWITLHAGYRNISYSPYTLGGHTMLGAGVELNPGKLRAGFMYGRLNRATTIDTTTQALVPFSFSRKGYAAKLGYGSERNFFELSFLKAKDDSTSAPNGIVPDSLFVTPEANTVLGYRFRFSFLKYFFIESDGAGSIYTRDLNSPIPLDSLDNEFLKRIKNFANINATSEFYTAFAGSIGFKKKGYGLKVNYRRIDPDFKSMGAYFFNSDIEDWTVAPSFTLLQNKVRFAGSIGFQHDNLKQQKQATNRRVIGSANMYLDFTQSLGLDVSYSNFSSNQRPQTARFADSLRIVQTTRNLSFMPRYFIITPGASHVITAAITFNDLNDYNTYFSDQGISRNISTKQYFLNYNITLPAKQLSLFINLNNTNLKGALLSDKYYGLTLGGNKSMLKNKLQTGLNASFTRGITDQGRSLIINSNANIGYQVRKNQTARLNWFLTNNRPATANQQLATFTESRTEISYIFNF
ncbi:hypothetical protein LJ707_03215 [Mucilaginibacter sp. UR6-1]|uniref:hypothetical protein n=1 Tax=Mucilaginibacter sp. UR6-1 TaxID=1435643 RepID=UPI001E6192CB|nr:hypothetical protein [Mucilaginibacter sp. UR6-1]MCC8407923.1 hypothetical protein [Mucilaginibacter sp. UR6-1]